MEKDLEFLKDLSNEELKELVNIIKIKSKIKIFGIKKLEIKTTELTEKEIENPNDNLDKITNELLKYSGNTFANLYRGLKNKFKHNEFKREGISYREALEYLCKRKKIKLEYKYMTTEKLGELLVEMDLKKREDQFVKIHSKLTEEQKQKFIDSLQEIGIDIKKSSNGVLLTTQQIAKYLFKSSGFNPYKIAPKIIKFIFASMGKKVPQWLYFGGLAKIIQKTAGVIFGRAISSLLYILFINDFAKPATRVIDDAILYIEYMRKNNSSTK